MTDLPEPAELPAVTADDALLDRLAAGASADTELGALLTTWRQELDAAADQAPLGRLSGLAARRPRWQRNVAGGAAVIVLLAASTGVAAAASGSRGPLGGLHKLLFGTEAPHRADPIVTTVTGVLDRVEHQIAQARVAGGITDRRRDVLGQQLDNAERLIDADEAAPASLGERAARDRAALDALPILATGPSGPEGSLEQRGGHGGSGDGPASDQGSDDGDTTGSSDRSDGTGSGDGRGDRTSGSDDGDTSGSDLSGRGGTDGDGTADGDEDSDPVGDTVDETGDDAHNGADDGELTDGDGGDDEAPDGSGDSSFDDGSGDSGSDEANGTGDSPV